MGGMLDAGLRSATETDLRHAAALLPSLNTSAYAKRRFRVSS